MMIANSIHKRIGKEIVLDGASMRLAPGELVGLIGASGAGKTILARCLIGLETWDSGTLTVDSIAVNRPFSVDDPTWESVRQKIGWVAQNRGLAPYRTVIEQVVEGPRHVRRMSREAAMEKALRWLEQLGLGPHIHKYPAELSGGQLARVCLARALAMEPMYLICDEVTANLDPTMAAEVAASLLEVGKTGLGVLMISHQLEFLRHHATRVDFLERGHIAASGSPMDMLQNPENEGLRRFLSGTALGR